MLKTQWRLISRIERVADNVIIIGIFFLAYHLRDTIIAAVNAVALPFPQPSGELAPIETYLIVLGAALALYNATLSMLGAYQSMRFSTFWKIFRKVGAASLLVLLCQGAVLYLLKLDLSRSFVVVFCLLSGLALTVERYFVLRYLRYWRVRGRNYRNLLIAGTGHQARKVYRLVMKQPELGIRVVGFVNLDDERSDGSVRLDAPAPVESLPAKIVASEETFEAALKQHAIDEVIFTEVVKNFSSLEHLAQIAAEEGVTVTLVADLFSLGIRRSDTSYFGSLPLIHYQTAPADNSAFAVKRILDFTASALGLIVLSPLMLFLALAIRLESKGPVFFRQERVGLNGRKFVLLKFRSMVENAEELLAELKSQNEMQGPVFKMKHDPRVTRIGRIIRRLSLDELPQLWNVFRGDMSLVGPRPPLPEEVSLYNRKHRRRLSMRPGITCTWQVSGRNEIPDFEEWMKLDLEYIDNWSLGNDVKLLFRTIPAVLSGSGAR